VNEPLRHGEGAVTGPIHAHPVQIEKEDEMKRFLILAVVSGLGLSACASAALPSAGLRADRANRQTLRSSAPPAPSQKAVPGKAKASEPDPRSCEPARGGTEGKLATLVDVRVGTHEGYDRVTFEFAPPADGQYFGLPPYAIVGATPPITEDGSGDPVSVEGSRFATVVFHGASGVDMTADEFTITYTGPRDFQPDFPVLAEARQTGDYEATLSWAFGLHRASCWRVLELQDPLRVAIDFPHD
jgi:hypothetical protein